MATNLYDKAYELSRAITQSPEYLGYLDAKNKVRANPKAWKMLQDFRRKQLAVEAARLAGQPLDSEKEQEVQNQLRVFMLHTEIMTFLNAESRFLQALSDVQRILAEGLEIDWDLDSMLAGTDTEDDREDQ